MFELIAIIAALAFALGTFLTKGITTQISFQKSIGPLFLFNALFVSPIALFQRNWILTEPKILMLHITGAIVSGLSAYLIFSIIARSTASVSAISSTLSPAVVLILAPLVLGTTIEKLQIIFVLVLIGSTLYPLRSSIPGLRSVRTFTLTLSASFGTAFVAINIVMLGAEGVNFSETFIVRQVIAGIFFVAVFPPTGLNRSDLFALLKRTSFVSLGWITYIFALQGGEIIVIVAIISTISFWVLLFEAISQRRFPERSTLIAAIIGVLGVSFLTYFT